MLRKGRGEKEEKQSQKYYWYEISCLRNVPNYTELDPSDRLV